MLKNKHKIFITVCYLLFAYTNAQTNLVPNPSFETYTTCPNQSGQVSYAIGWSIFRADADYFNACANPSYIYNNHSLGVPANAAGYQYAASGIGYMGFYTYFPVNNTLYALGDYREAIGCQLTNTLTVGTRYYVSLKASLCSIDSADEFSTATNNLGVLFSTVPYNCNTAAAPINNRAQVYGHTIITDTANWTQIFGSFVADSAYKYISLGNFFDSTHTSKTVFYNYHNDEFFAYYYWDDICVSTDSVFSANYTWTGIEEYNISKQQISLYPNPSFNGVFYSTVAFANEQVEVFDVLGNSLKKLSINGNGIDLSYLDNGIYVIQFNNQYQSKQKIIINK
jgi:type IX secretion system substrate protein